MQLTGQSIFFRQLCYRGSPTRSLQSLDQPFIACGIGVLDWWFLSYWSIRYVPISPCDDRPTSARFTCPGVMWELDYGADELVHEPIEFAGKVITPQNLYMGLFVIGIPLLWFAAPISTFFWLVGSSGCVIGAHAGLMEPGVESYVTPPSLGYQISQGRADDD